MKIIVSIDIGDEDFEDTKASLREILCPYGEVLEILPTVTPGPPQRPNRFPPIEELTPVQREAVEDVGRSILRGVNAMIVEELKAGTGKTLDHCGPGANQT